MPGNTTTTAILKLDPDAVQLATTVAAKSMLCGFLKWEKSIPARDRLALVGDFVKRVSAWHEIVLIPMSLRAQCSLYLNPPVYSKRVLQHEKLLEMEGGIYSIFELHARLLVAASKSLLNCLKRGLGKDTKKQIQLWFNLLKKKNVKNAEDSTRRIFITVQKVHEAEVAKETEADTESEEGQEYVYFDYKVLFIYLAHMVHFTCVETKSTVVSTSLYQMKVSKAMIEMWEKEVGTFSNTRLRFPDNGSLLEGQRGADPAFAWIFLPRNQFREETSAGEKALPSITEMHMHLMHMISSKITEMQHGKDIGNHEMQQTGRLDDWFAATGAALTKCTRKVYTREKARKNHRKTNLKSARKNRSFYRYNPADPHTFERDIFLLGKESYFYLFNTEAGRVFRKLAVWTTEEMPVQEEDPDVQSLDPLDHMMMNMNGMGEDWI